MRRLVFTFLTFATVCLAQEESVRQGINEKFLDPNLKPEETENYFVRFRRK